jgi:hypothetical protein
VEVFGQVHDVEDVFLDARAAEAHRAVESSSTSSASSGWAT